MDDEEEIIKKGTFDYKIKCYSPTEYDLQIIVKVEGTLMKYVFSKAIAHKKIKDKLKSDVNLNNVTEFEVPEKWYKLILTGIHSMLVTVRKKFAADKIILATEKINKVTYRKEGEFYLCTINLNGLYSDMRYT